MWLLLNDLHYTMHIITTKCKKEESIERRMYRVLRVAWQNGLK